MGARGFETGERAFANQVALKLGECGEDLEHQLGVGETVSIFSVIVTGLDLD